MIKGNGLAYVGIVNAPLFIDSMTITECTFHLPLIVVTLHRAPSALAQNDIFSNPPRRMRTYDNHVGLVTLAKESTPFDTKQTSWMVTH